MPLQCALIAVQCVCYVINAAWAVWNKASYDEFYLGLQSVKPVSGVQESAAGFLVNIATRLGSLCKNLFVYLEYQAVGYLAINNWNSVAMPSTD